MGNWESTLDLVGLEVCFPVIGEIPRVMLFTIDIKIPVIPDRK